MDFIIGLPKSEGKSVIMVIPPFNQRQPFDPLCMFIRYKATNISFQPFVYYLSFPIRLRMIR